MEAKDCVPGTKVKIPTTSKEGSWLNTEKLQSEIKEKGWLIPYLTVYLSPDEDGEAALCFETPDDLKENLAHIEDLEPYEEVISQDYTLLEQEDSEETTYHREMGIPIKGEEEVLVADGEDVSAPPHYNSTSITPFQVIDSWGLDFYLGNVLKYLCRNEKKGQQLSDLKKAKRYLEVKINQLENGTAK